MSEPKTHVEADPKLPATITPTDRLLTAERFQRLSDVPPEVEWFANISNRHTRRSYENAVKDFVRFAGIMRPEEFRNVTRAHLIAWRDELRRVLRPGGYLLLTLHGDTYVERLSDSERRLFADGECVVRWPDAVGSNLCTTFHPPAFVRDRLADGWALVEHLPDRTLGQDLVLLRRPPT